MHRPTSPVCPARPTRPQRYGLTADDVEFSTFFATLPPGFEEQAGQLLQSGLNAREDPAAAVAATRMTQAYDSGFWQSPAINPEP